MDLARARREIYILCPLIVSVSDGKMLGLNCLVSGRGFVDGHACIMSAPLRTAHYGGCHQDQQPRHILIAGDVADILQAGDVAYAGQTAQSARLLPGKIAEHHRGFAFFQRQYAGELLAIEDWNVVEAGAAERIDLQFHG